MITPATHQCDAYKLGHISMYPEGTTLVYNNFTPRSEKLSNIPQNMRSGEVVVMGVQRFVMYLRDIWNETFFDKDKDEVVGKWERDILPMVGAKGYSTAHMEALHDLGYLPLCVKALPDGTSVPFSVPVLTVHNTHQDFFWLPGYLEDMISAELWKVITNATTAKAYRKLMEQYADITGGNKQFIDWQCHDFSLRGMSGIDDAATSGMGHLMFFAGTDNLPSVYRAKDCYCGEFVYGSVPATEHSVMCAGGMETEEDTFRRLIEMYPSGILSVVSDTWDYWNVLTETVPKLKDIIMSRQEDSFGNCKLVLRPDSGNPVDIICGDALHFDSVVDATDYVMKKGCRKTNFVVDGKYYTASVSDLCSHGNWCDWSRYEVDVTPQMKGSVEVLWETFGGTVNEKGFKTLDKHIGLIYGDSITLERAEEILSRLAANGFASDNIVFGIGSYTYNYLTRDTNGFAVKATYVEIDGEGKAIFKAPKTDSGTKKSAKGLLAVVKDSEGTLRLEQGIDSLDAQSELSTFFLDGAVFMRSGSMVDVRKRVGSMSY